MSDWHRGVMLALDLETTSADVEAARVVTACVSAVDGSGRAAPETRNWLVYPGIDIPAEATAVHGIATAVAEQHGQHPLEALPEIMAAVLREPWVPVVAFNASYDLTVLDREARRNGLESFGSELDGAKVVVIDPFVLDKALDPYRRGSRKLGAVAAHYGVKAEGAHSADGDAAAAARVAWKIAATYPHIAQMSLSELHAYQVKERAKQARSFADYLRKQGKDAEAAKVDTAWPWRPLTSEVSA